MNTFYINTDPFLHIKHSLFILKDENQIWLSSMIKESQNTKQNYLGQIKKKHLTILIISSTGKFESKFASIE